MRVEYNINKVQDTSYPLAQYGLLDVHSPVAPGLTPYARGMSPDVVHRFVRSPGAPRPMADMLDPFPLGFGKADAADPSSLGSGEADAPDP
jgi:hypothetical protein